MSVALMAGGCDLPDRDVLTTEPDESQIREAYLDTPLIASEQGRAIRPGESLSDVVARLGRSQIEYERGPRRCALYPIQGTGRRDELGSPVADEWEICFDHDGRVFSTQRIVHR